MFSEHLNKGKQMNHFNKGGKSLEDADSIGMKCSALQIRTQMIIKNISILGHACEWKVSLLNAEKK